MIRRRSNLVSFALFRRELRLRIVSARAHSQPENPYFTLINDQTIAVIPEFTLESGVTLQQVPVAYKTYGQLNDQRNNVMLICHALTGSADVADWWGPLIGPGRAFDTTRFFVICLNSLGSPYGSASPCTLNVETGRRFGPEFPLTTVRDDVRYVNLCNFLAKTYESHFQNSPACSR